MPNTKLWTAPLPRQSLEGGNALLQELRWNIEVNKNETGWNVYAGHKLILQTTSEEAVEALLFGMALSYSVMPDNILKQVRDFAEQACT